LVVELETTLLEDANIGDIVQVRTKQGKLFKAKLVSQHEAIIQQ